MLKSTRAFKNVFYSTEMIRALLLLVLFGAVLSFRTYKPKYCYATDENPYLLMGTKTPYETVRGNDGTLLNECTPLQFWSINRHGTRLPGKRAIRQLMDLTDLQQQILDNYDEYNSYYSMCEEDIELLRNWTWDGRITEANGSTLVQEGWNEMRNMARRNAKRFPELLGLSYSEQNYLFRHTNSQRTNASVRAYAEGLFGSYENINAECYKYDTLLEAYKHCPYWDEQVYDNPATNEEYRQFIASNEFVHLIHMVSKRLGFNHYLDIRVIDDIYGMCRFQQAWHPDRLSPWCAAFTHEDLRVMEYAEDLQYYYGLGHGMELNKQMGCMPLQDMMRRFESIVNGSTSEPRSVHYFSHSAELQLLIVSMGMFQDEIPLTAENYKEQQNRVWRTSLIGPFATNINAVLYRCDEADYNVVFYNNERIYEFPGCEGGVCSWKNVRQRFSDIAESCSMDFCNN